MAALFVMFVVGTLGAFTFLQVVFPLLLNRPVFSWFRNKSRLDNLRQRIRVAKQDALTEDAEHNLNEFLDDRIDKITNR